MVQITPGITSTTGNGGAVDPKLTQLAGQTAVAGQRLTFSEHVLIDDANVAHSETSFLVDPMVFALDLTQDEGVPRTKTYPNGGMTFAALNGGVLEMELSWSLSQYSGNPPILETLALVFAEHTFTFPVSSISAIDPPVGPVSIAINIPDVDYSASFGEPCQLVLGYRFEGAYYHGSFTVTAVRNYQIGPLREAIEAIADAKARAMVAPLMARIEALAATPGGDLSSIADQISPIISIDRERPEVSALFKSSNGADGAPTAIAQMTAVSPENPRYTATTTHVWIAVEPPGTHSLKNITSGTETPLNSGNIVSSFLEGGQSHFVYRVGGIAVGDVLEVEDDTTAKVAEWAYRIERSEARMATLEMLIKAATLPSDLQNMLVNETHVTEEEMRTVTPSAYNLSLGDDPATAAIAEETGNGQSNISDAISARLNTDFYRHKIAFVTHPGTIMSGQHVMAAVHGNVFTALVTLDDGQYNGKQYVPAIAAGQRDVTVYPRPRNGFGAQGHFFSVLTAVYGANGLPQPHNQELQLDADVPAAATPITVEYYGDANGRVVPGGTVQLAGVGGPDAVSTQVQMVAGPETVTLSIEWDPAHKWISMKVLETFAGSEFELFTDVNANVRFTETRTVPATPATVRNVNLGAAKTQGVQIFAVGVSGTNTVTLISDAYHFDTGYTWNGILGADGSGTLQILGAESFFLDSKINAPSQALLAAWQDRFGLQGHGFFDTVLTEESDWALDVTLVPSKINFASVPKSATGLVRGDVYVYNTRLRVVE